MAGRNGKTGPEEGDLVIGPEEGDHEIGLDEGDHLGAGRISKLLEEVARTSDGEPGEWVGPTVGSSVDQFDLLRVIGGGGFGLVYEAYDRKLGRVVALKAIRPGPEALAEARRKCLEREAVAAAHLSHPNIVTLHDMGASECGPYLVLEMLHGETLKERLARGALPLAEAVKVGVDVASALAHAHPRGVFHRDLKPSNVFLTEEGGVKVLDFGLASFFGESGMRGGGTPGYMAPEQWRGEGEDSRTDVFGLGVLLFEMLTGRLPYPVERGRSAALDPGPAPALPGVPQALAALVRDALSKEPGRRPPDGRAMLEGLFEAQRALAGREAGEVSAKAAWLGRSHRLPPWMPRSGLIAAIAAALAVALAWISWEHLRSREPAGIHVVVVDLSNDTGDPELDNKSDLFIASLAQLQLLAPQTRQQMLDILARLGRSDVKRIDEALGRLIARQAQAKALLLTSIHRFDREYAIELRAIDPLRDEYLFALKEQGTGKSSIPGMFDRLSYRLSHGLRLRMHEREAAVRDLGPAIVEAYQHYFRSQECMYQTSFGQSCAGELEKALAVDPTFALAHYQLAVWQARHGGPRAEQDAATEAAVRYIDRVPRKERMLIRAWKAHHDGNDDQALGILDELIRLYPRDREAVSEAGELLYHRSDFAGAVPHFEKLVELDPTHGWGLDHLVHSLGALHRREELRKRVEGWKGVPQNQPILHALSAAYDWLGDYPAAAAAALRAAEVSGGLSAQEDLLFTGIIAGDYGRLQADIRRLVVPGSPAPVIGYYALAALDAYQGRRRQGLDRFDALRRDVADADDTLFHSFRAHYLAGDGRPGPVWEEARTLLATDPNVASGHAVTLAWLGDLEHAAVLAVYLRPGSLRQQTYQAVVLWQRGEPAEALRRLRDIAGRSPFDVDFALAPAYLYADLAARSGADAEAVVALRDFQSLFIPTMMWRSWAYPRSLYLAAASLERLGRPAEAMEQLNRLLGQWKGAEPEQPLLKNARALRARLAATLESARSAAR